jgi:sodium/hydrogen antiporter
MALEAVAVLTQISVLLLVGILGSALAHHLKVSNVFILLVLGTGIGIVSDAFSFESVFLVGLAIMTLAMVVFEGTTKFSFRQLDIYSGPALRLTGWYLFFVCILVGMGSYLLFFSGLPGGWVLSFVLATALAGTDASSIVLILKSSTGKLVRMLTIESIINTPIMVLLPFIVLGLIERSLSVEHFTDIITQVVVGIGAGVVVGLILFKALRRYYAKDLSSVAVVAGALISYLSAENLGGSGVLAVATLGIIFGNVTIKNKEELNDFSFAFGSVLEILVFLLIGILVGGSMQLTWALTFGSLIIFLLIVLARFIASWIVFAKESSWAELAFVTLSMPRGIAVAVLIFIFSSPLYAGLVPEVLVNVLFLVTLYSILLATVVAWWWNTFEPAKEA